MYAVGVMNICFRNQTKDTSGNNGDALENLAAQAEFQVWPSTMHFKNPSIAHPQSPD